MLPSGLFFLSMCNYISILVYLQTFVPGHHLHFQGLRTIYHNVLNQPATFSISFSTMPGVELEHLLQSRCQP